MSLEQVDEGGRGQKGELLQLGVTQSCIFHGDTLVTLASIDDVGG